MLVSVQVRPFALEVPDALRLILPPMKESPPIPTPPVTTCAPVVVEVEAVADATIRAASVLSIAPFAVVVYQLAFEPMDIPYDFPAPPTICSSPLPAMYPAVDPSVRTGAGSVAVVPPRDMPNTMVVEPFRVQSTSSCVPRLAPDQLPLAIPMKLKLLVVMRSEE